MTRYWCILLLTGLSHAEWTRFRGPNGSGVAAGKGLPEAMSAL